MLDFPTRLLLGRLTPQETFDGLAAQGLWLLMSVVALAFVWRAGVRRYAAVGG